VIGSGEVVARIVGSFSVPPLVALLGVQNLLLLSGAALLACLVLTALVLREPAAVAAAPASPAKAVARPRRGVLARLSGLLADRYLLFILALAFLGVLGKFFVDFAFLEQMRSRHADAKSLATFFALFSGMTQVGSLLARVLLSGRLLDRYGIRIGLLVLPAAHLACTGLVVLCGALELPAAVFWLVIANQGVYKVLKHPIDNPSFKVLYQPLGREQRLATQIAVETLVTPVGIGLAGGVMLLFSRAIPYDPTIFAWALLATFGAWLAVAKLAWRQYPAALEKALKGRIVDVGVFQYGDEESMKLLRERLRSGNAQDALHALDLLEKSEADGFGGLLLDVLEHPAADVRQAAIERLGELKPVGARDAVLRLVGREVVMAVKAKAIQCLATLGGREASDTIAPYLDDADPAVRRAALIGLLRVGVSMAGGYLEDRARSRQPESRAWAAHVIAEVGRPGLNVLLITLLRDPEPAVRRAAFAAAAKVRDADLWPIVAASLADRTVTSAGASALAAGGADALPALDEAFRTAREPRVLAEVARILGRIGGERAVALLRERAGHPEPRVRRGVLEALRRCGYRAVGADAAALQEAMRREIEDAAWELAALRDVGDSEAVSLLRAALGSEVVETRQRVLLLLSLLYEPTSIQRVRDALAHGTREKRAYALEMLDVTLSGELRAMLLPLFEELTLEARCERLAEHFPQARTSLEERLREVLAREARLTSPWTRAAALDAAVGVGAAGLIDAIEPLADPGSSALVAETAGWALAKLEGREPEGGRRPMLTIEKVLILKGVHMFAGTSEEILADVAAILDEALYKAGEVVINKGDFGDSMYIIVEGKVRVYDGDRTITFLGARDIFGELALLDPEPRIASIVAVVDTHLFRLDREAFSELMAGNIEIVRGVLHVLCQRVRRQGRYEDAPAPPGAPQVPSPPS